MQYVRLKEVVGPPTEQVEGGSAADGRRARRGPARRRLNRIGAIAGGPICVLIVRQALDGQGKVTKTRSRYYAKGLFELCRMQIPQGQKNYYLSTKGKRSRTVETHRPEGRTTGKLKVPLLSVHPMPGVPCRLCRLACLLIGACAGVRKPSTCLE